MIIAIETGMRQSEQAGLSWSCVDLEGRRPHVDLTRTKNDRARRVPLSPRAVEAFRSLERKGERVLPIETRSGIVQAFRDAVDRKKDFLDLRWHDLRHEAISRLFEFTDLRDSEIMAISGHLTPAKLARYTHLRADRLGDRLPGGSLNRVRDDPPA